MAGPTGILGSAISMSRLANFLSGRLGRPVIDKTNLKGYYDVRLEFAPETVPGGAPVGPPPVPGPTAPPGAPDPAGPSIFTAIQEQFGLRLESAKDQIPGLVVDSIQKPAEN
jgi:bla regulator protein blaR1